MTRPRAALLPGGETRPGETFVCGGRVYEVFESLPFGNNICRSGGRIGEFTDKAIRAFQARTVMHCPHCNVQHVDKNTPKTKYAEEPHTRHLCLRGDGGCGRFFFTKALIGVAKLDGAAGPVAGVGAVAPG